jgi:hypothetical protein
LPTEEADEDGTAPRFVVDFKDVVVAEASGNAYFEAQLEPRGDSRMELEWTLNGKSLQESESLFSCRLTVNPGTEHYSLLGSFVS